MKIYPEEIVQKARELRTQGLSYKEIGRTLNIPDATIRKWCFHTPGGKGSSQREIERNEKTRSKLFEKGKRLVKKLNLNKMSREQARLFAGLLYWCEGTKYPIAARVNFVNSDEQMMLTFLALLRKGFDINEKKIRVHLQIHDYHDLEELKKHWSRLLGIPKNQFLKPTVTKPTGNRRRSSYRGTCTLRYYDYRALLVLTSIYKNFAGTVILGHGGVYRIGKVAPC